MSALSKPKILTKMRRGELSISPILRDRQISASSVDLRLGCVALSVRARGVPYVDPVAHVERKESGEHRLREIDRRQRHERHEIPFLSKFILHPGMLVLAPTLEWVKLSDGLQGIVTARSSWARQGLSIATATLINPGYEGIITLELANMGQIPILLYPGLRIAQIALYELSSPREKGGGEKSQFNLSFEPKEGDIAKQDEYFLPAPKEQTDVSDAGKRR
jgi:dCTP deaminase